VQLGACTCVQPCCLLLPPQRNNACYRRWSLWGLHQTCPPPRCHPVDLDCSKALPSTLAGCSTCLQHWVTPNIVSTPTGCPRGAQPSCLRTGGGGPRPPPPPPAWPAECSVPCINHTLRWHLTIMMSPARRARCCPHRQPHRKRRSTQHARRAAHKPAPRRTAQVRHHFRP
jgi:hypothetical protein